MKMYNKPKEGGNISKGEDLKWGGGEEDKVERASAGSGNAKFPLQTRNQGGKQCLMFKKG